VWKNLKTAGDGKLSMEIKNVPFVNSVTFFRIQPIRNNNCLCLPCLLTDRDEKCSHYRRPSIDDSYQVSVHLAEVFQRGRLKWKKLTDAKWSKPSKLEEKEKFYITSKYANIEIFPFCAPLKNCNSLIITLYIFLKWFSEGLP
jgi:hypothetical protein